MCSNLGVIMSKFNDLKQVLFDEYEGFSDKRLKDTSRGSTFIIDDRTDGDIGAKKQLYSYFCKMFAVVESKEQITIRMTGNVPKSSSVTNWMNDNDHDYSEDIFNSLTFKIHPHDCDKLKSLAKAIKSIVKPGAKYDTPNYKYVCPRTSDSLLRLHRLLSKTWQ